MQQPLNRFLLLQPVWLPTVLFIPLLYALGWLAAVPLTLLGLPTDQLSLTGTVLSFVLFLLVMISSFFAASCLDPGIIPRNLKPCDSNPETVKIENGVMYKW